MSSVVRLAFCIALLVTNLHAQARDLYILVVGEGSAGNCNAHSYGEVADVLQIGLDGHIKPASDPLDWADCKGGSVWVPLGQAIISQGMAQKVIFMPVALSGARARDWVANGRGAALLARAISVANKQHITFDYAFVHQGYSDGDTEGALYRKDLRQMIQSTSLKIKVGLWLVAQGGGCTVNGAPQIAAVQSDFAMGHHLRRFAGPDFSTFFAAELGTACTFTALGQQKAAQSWLDSMKLAAHANEIVQKESLLYYFR